MRRIFVCVVLVQLLAAFGEAAAVRHIRPFENSDFVKGSSAGFKIEEAFNRSHGRLLLERTVLAQETHYHGEWRLILGALDRSPISKKAQAFIEARDEFGTLIQRVKDNATRRAFNDQGLRNEGNTYNALDFVFPEIQVDIPAGGTLDFKN